jgi:hypothetical protein
MVSLFQTNWVMPVISLEREGTSLDDIIIVSYTATCAAFAEATSIKREEAIESFIILDE